MVYESPYNDPIKKEPVMRYPTGSKKGNAVIAIIIAVLIPIILVVGVIVYGVQKMGAQPVEATAK